MIDVKEAVQAARIYAQEVLGRGDATVEEIERETYKGHEVWKITLGFSSHTFNAGRAALGLSNRDYKSILIDAETGEPLAIKIRVLTS